MARSNQTQDESSTMSPTRTVFIIIGLLLFIIAWYALVNSDSSSDQANNTETTSEQKQDAVTAEESKKDADASARAASQARAAAERGEVSETFVAAEGDTYSYVAGSGESYTGLARRAVAALDSELTPAERVAAETKLTLEASARMLNAGEEVSLKKSDVEAAVKWAQGLTAEQKAAWQPYADTVAW